MIKLNSSRFLSTSRIILQEVTKAPKSIIQSSCVVGTPLNLGIKKGGKSPVALEDREYPEWLWTVLGSKSIKTVSSTSKEIQTPEQDLKQRRKQLRKENRSNIKQNNFISQL